MGWYDDYPDNWDEIRKAVYKRDGYTCQSCGRKGGSQGNVELHCHHVTPKSEGGSNHPRNLVTLCWRCHNAQHDHHIQRMSDVSATPSSSRRSRYTGSVGHGTESMDAETKQLRDIYIGVSGEKGSSDAEDEHEEQGTDDTVDTDIEIEREVTEYNCPNCYDSITTAGWFSLYCHFDDCEFPAERPPAISESHWERILNRRDSYQCPNCGERVERTDRLGFYQHFRDCRLPSKRPESLSKRDWKKLQSRVGIKPAQPPGYNTSPDAFVSADGLSAFIIWLLVVAGSTLAAGAPVPAAIFLGTVVAIGFYGWQKS